MKKSFPVYGIFGVFLLLISELFFYHKVDPFYSWFYCFAWWSYILIVDAVIYRLKGNSLLHNRTKEFFLMIPWSVFIWLIFEGANLFLKNWYYINLPCSLFERWSGYLIAYGTVLPGIFETTELLEALGLLKKWKTGQMRLSGFGQVSLVVLGALCLIVTWLVPEYYFPLIWVGFIFLLEPFNCRFGSSSLLKDLEEGRPRKIVLLLIAGLICGLLWEFWNFWSQSKWVYTIPFFDKTKGFEMPFIGFLGFPPFAVQAYVMYNFISLFRAGRGWEKSTHRLHPNQKTRFLTILLTFFLMASFYCLVFRAIDSGTVDSFVTRLEDAYWIDPLYREKLPKIGVDRLDDLVSISRNKTNLDALALRLMIPREDLTVWVEKARLVQLKGLGVDNLQLLERLGIHSVGDLAALDPDSLYQRIRYSCPGETRFTRAKINIWIREARKLVGGNSS